jgi:transcriptional regulator GlxA family with amidase domain
MHDVTVVLLDEGMFSTAVTPVEVFHSAGVLWNELQGRPPEPAFKVRMVSTTGAPVRTGYGGMTLVPDGGLADVARTDLVIVAASGADFDRQLAQNAVLTSWLREQHAQGAYIAGVCTGVLYLAEAGLLDGRLATTHWATADLLAARYPQVRWRPEFFVTEDFRVLCSGGVYASADVSLYLVAKLCGHRVAMQCARALLLPMPRACQSGYAMLPVSRPHGDERIRAIEHFLQASFAEDLPTPRLAEQAGMGVRTFVRHFKAATGKLPGAYLQALRIEAAKALLETSAKPVQSISQEVGYADVVFFRGLFKRETGMTPAEYRSHFAPLSIGGVAGL